MVRRVRKEREEATSVLRAHLVRNAPAGFVSHNTKPNDGDTMIQGQRFATKGRVAKAAQCSGVDTAVLGDLTMAETARQVASGHPPEQAMMQACRVCPLVGADWR